MNIIGLTDHTLYLILPIRDCSRTENKTVKCNIHFVVTFFWKVGKYSVWIWNSKKTYRIPAKSVNRQNSEQEIFSPKWTKSKDSCWLLSTFNLHKMKCRRYVMVDKETIENVKCRMCADITNLLLQIESNWI